MKCPRCGSTDVNVQIFSETEIRKKKKSVWYWIFVGWYLEPILWIFLTLPKLIWELIKPRRYKVETKTREIAVCQNCGKTWTV